MPELIVTWAFFTRHSRETGIHPFIYPELYLLPDIHEQLTCSFSLLAQRKRTKRNGSPVARCCALPSFIKVT